MGWNCTKCGVHNEAVQNSCWRCWAERGSIPSLEELRSPELENFLAYVKPQKEHATLKSIAFLVLAGSLFLIGGAVGPRLGCLFSIPLIFAVFSLVRSARRHARRYRTDPHQKLLRDRRPPVLYLRPFKADEESELASSNETLEEKLISQLEGIGPAVAVGVPGEDLPALGAIRFYFTHSEWQEKVETLMSISQLVVIHAGFTEGVEWELKTSLKLLNPKKVVISFLSWQALDPRRCQSNYEVFLMLAERVFGKKYELFPKRIDNNYFMYFDAEWAPSFSGPETDRYKVTPRDIRTALEPIFRNATTNKKALAEKNK